MVTRGEKKIFTKKKTGIRRSFLGTKEILVNNQFKGPVTKPDEIDTWCKACNVNAVYSRLNNTCLYYLTLHISHCKRTHPVCDDIDLALSRVGKQHRLFSFIRAGIREPGGTVCRHCPGAAGSKSDIVIFQLEPVDVESTAADV